MKARTKTEVVKVRLTKREKENLRRAAAREHLTISEYVRRNIAVPPEVTRTEFNQLQQEYIYQIRKIGVNINQIAKKYNEYHYTQPRKDLIDRMDRINKLSETVVSILRKKGG